MAIIGKSPAQAAHEKATDVYKNLVKLRRELEFGRSVEKEAAIKRVLESGEAKSATAAEKLVESDSKYHTYCATLTWTIVSEIQAKEELLVSRALRIAEITSSFVDLGMLHTSETVDSQERVGGPEHAP